MINIFLNYKLLKRKYTKNLTCLETFHVFFDLFMINKKSAAPSPFPLSYRDIPIKKEAFSATTL